MSYSHQIIIGKLNQVIISKLNQGNMEAYNVIL